jgi:phage baseplate assembly protein W
MFPFDLEEEEVTPIITKNNEPIDYEVDWNTGRLTGKIITGLDAIIQWARIVLKTERYYYPQYSWDHGSDLTELIGQQYDPEYIKCEVKRMIEDALLINEDVIGIEDLECSFEDDNLTASFTLNTIYGGGEIIV